MLKLLVTVIWRVFLAFQSEHATSKSLEVADNAFILHR